MSSESATLGAWEQIGSWINDIAGDIRYGKVEITIHDARVVQLEVTEKIRSPASAPTSKPGTCSVSP